MKTIIAGSRIFDNYNLLDECVSRLHRSIGITEVICGGAKGADLLGKRWAEFNNICVKMFPANWNKFGISAGYDRNTEMAEYAKDGLLIAFWDGASKGTKNMISEASKRNLKIIIYRYDKIEYDW